MLTHTIMAMAMVTHTMSRLTSSTRRQQTNKRLLTVTTMQSLLGHQRWTITSMGMDMDTSMGMDMNTSMDMDMRMGVRDTRPTMGIGIVTTTVHSHRLQEPALDPGRLLSPRETQG